MRETQKGEFTILPMNQNWEIPTVFQSEEVQYNNINENLRVAVKKEDYLKLKQLNKY